MKQDQNQNQQPQAQQQWQGFERRQSLGQYQGAERRKQPAGYTAGDGHAGVNAEEPSNAQDERAQQREPGPNPRIPK